MNKTHFKKRHKLKKTELTRVLVLSFSLLFFVIVFQYISFTGNVTKTIDENYYWNGTKGIGLHDSHYEDLAGIKDLDIKMIRDDIPWGVVETTKGVYDFSYYDNKTSQLLAQGIEPIYIIDYSNCLYNSMPSNRGYDCYLYVPTNATKFEIFKKAYGNYTYEVVKHYKGKVKYFELWNEPNWFWEPVNEEANETQALQYIELMKEGYKRAKEANSDAIIISAGMNTDNLARIDRYIKNYYLQGAKDSFDILAIHPYCPYEQTYPLAEQGKTCDALENIAYVKQIVDSYNDSDKKIWITEFGYPTGGDENIGDYDYGANLNEDNQNTRIINVFSTLNQNYPYVTGFFWYDYMDDCEETPLDTECRFGLVRSDLSKKPAYYTYQNLSSSPGVSNSSNSTSNTTTNQTQTNNSSNQTNVSSNSTNQSNTTSQTNTITSSVTSGSSSGGGGGGSITTTNSSESTLSSNSNVSETNTEVPASSRISGSGEKVSSSRDAPSAVYKKDSKEVLTMTSAESNKCCTSDSCYPVGKVIDGKYCDESSKQFISQKEINEECNNSFECISNTCAINKCSSESFISKVIKSIKGIFTN